jgi:hypothetical protein
VIGCVYIYPLPDSDYDACALSWGRRATRCVGASWLLGGTGDVAGCGRDRPQTLHTERSLVSDPDSVGVRLTRADGDVVAEVVLYRGGWADVTLATLSRLPDDNIVYRGSTRRESGGLRRSSRRHC